MQPTERVCVVKLAGWYAAIHELPRSIQFISDRAETDIRVAQAAAQSFATTRGIVYERRIGKFDIPIITVCERGGQWFPAELHPDQLTLLTEFDSRPLGGSQQEAEAIAHLIATQRGVDSLPSIGISLSNNQ